MKIAIIGGGAAGFFAAANIKSHEVSVFEKSSDVMQKVKVSGGGRCNITNSEIELNSLNKYYPRGHKELRQAMNIFGCIETMKWFEKHGLKLKIEQEGKVFPVSDMSEDVINLLKKSKAKIFLNKEAIDIIPENGKYILKFRNEVRSYIFDKVIVSIGGFNKPRLFKNLNLA